MTHNSVSNKKTNVAAVGSTPSKSKKEYITFAALKLIEQLYRDGAIKEHIYANILKENANIVDITQFAYAG